MGIKFEVGNLSEFWSEFWTCYLSDFKFLVLLMRRLMWIYFLVQYIWPLVYSESFRIVYFMVVFIPWFLIFQCLGMSLVFSPLYWGGIGRPFPFQSQDSNSLLLESCILYFLSSISSVISSHPLTPEIPIQ